jgi:DNA-binding LacI/PurR family transcriptional regulator
LTVKQPRSKVMPTIKEVAEAAGVSRATVSRAFGKPALLNPNTVEHVRSVASQLGYVPNQVARALSTGKAGNIGLIVPDIANPFFSALIRAAQAHANTVGYCTILGDSDECPALEDVLLGKLAPQVEGFILASSRLSKQRISAHAIRRPLVLINRDVPGIPKVLIDAAASFEKAVDLLASLGHRSAVYVGAPKESWANQRRQAAVLKAALRNGIAANVLDVSRPTYDEGRLCAGQILATGATAVLAVDDLVAQGVMRGLSERKVSVPDHISVVGCDDIIAATTHPPLSTIAVNCRDAGRCAAELLIALLNGPPPSKTELIVKSDLILRQTIAPPRFSLSQ